MTRWPIHLPSALCDQCTASQLSAWSSSPCLEPAVCAPGAWKGELRVIAIRDEVPNVRTFLLAHPTLRVLPFRHLPGQSLVLSVLPDGPPLQRNYTIASSPTRRCHCEITVKRNGHDAVSCYLHDRIRVGDWLAISAPNGELTFTGHEAQRIVLIAGGLGVTPMMSVIRYLTDVSWSGHIHLLYSCRTPRDLVFAGELESLQRRHANLHVTATVTRHYGAGWRGPTGRLTAELIRDSVPDLQNCRIYLCGPPAMMTAVESMLDALDVHPQQIKTEAFHRRIPAGNGARAAARPSAAPSTTSDSGR